MTRRELRGLTAREFMRALERDGFFLVRSSGSHRVYRHENGRRIIVAFHSPGETFAPGTLSAMLRQACWTDFDLIRLELVPGDNSRSEAA